MEASQPEQDFHSVRAREMRGLMVGPELRIGFDFEGVQIQVWEKKARGRSVVRRD